MLHQTTVEPPAVGSVLAGRYRLIEELGRGGVGVVYRAQHLLLGHQVAVKVLLSADEEAKSRFQREAQALSKVHHRNVCAASDFGPTGRNGFYLVIEYLEGEDLSATLEREGKLHPERAVGLFTQLLSALAACHRAGVVHRDLKPSNVLIVREADGSETLKLVDFGIVGYQGDAARATKKLTAIGLTLGTPHYMSPEQACADQALDGRSDLYQVGVMLFEALTGSVPFDDQDLANVLWQQVHAKAPRLADKMANKTDADRFEPIVARLLKKDRNARFQHPQEVIAALTMTRRPAKPSPKRRTRKPAAMSGDSRYRATLRRLRWRRLLRQARTGALVTFLALMGVAAAVGLWALGNDTVSPARAHSPVASLSGVAPSHPGTDAPRLLLKTHVVAAAVKRGEPKAITNAFPKKTRKVYCHASFDNPVGTKRLYMQWWFGDKRVDQDRLRVKAGPSSKVWASTTIRRRQKGPWRCDIVTKAGTLVSSRTFHVVVD